MLDEAGALRRDADSIAERFVDLLFRFVWKPFVDAGMPADELPRITEIVERLRPVAAMAMLPALANAMSRKVNAAIGSELAHVAEDKITVGSEPATTVFLSDAAPIASPTWTLHGEVGRRATLRRLWAGG